jgi:hypothetical protein
MVSPHRNRLIVFAGCTLALVGCNTEAELAQQRLNVLRAEADSLEALKKDLSATPAGASALEGPGAVSIFLSKRLINSALKLLDGITVPVPGGTSGTITVKSVSADLQLGYPLVRVDAEATRKDIGLTLQVVGTARLETSIDPARPSQMTISVRLEELVPRAKWGIFDFKIGGFVKDVIKAKVSKELSTLAVFQVPISADIPLALPASSMPVSFRGARGVVNTPAMTVLGHAIVSRVLVLPDGLHIYGTVSAKASP